MAEGQLSVEMTGDAARLLREIQKQADLVEKLKAQIKSLKDDYEKTGKQGEDSQNRVAKATDDLAKKKWEEDRAIKATKKSWEEQAKAADESTNQSQRAVASIVGSIGAWAAGIASVRTAYSLVSAEIRNLIDLQEKAKNAIKDVSSSEKDIIRNMPGASRADVDRAIAGGREIAGSENVSVVAINKAIAEGLSASGGNLFATLSAVRTSAQFIGDRPDTLGMYTGAMLDLSKVTGSPDASVNRGLLAFVGGMSRVTNPLTQAEHIPKALIGVQNFGATAAEATALYAALSVGASDSQGRQSGTGAIRLAEQLRSFLPAEGVEAKIKKEGLSDVEQEEYRRLLNSSSYKEAMRRKAAGIEPSDSQLRVLKRAEVFARRERGEIIEDGRPGLASFGERLSYLQAHPEMAKKFLSEASFEAKVMGPIEQLLTDPHSVTSMEYRKNLATMPGLDPQILAMEIGATPQISRQLLGIGLPEVMGQIAGDAGNVFAQQQAFSGMGMDIINRMKERPLSKVGGLRRAYENTTEELLIGNITGAMGAVNREGLSSVLQAAGQGALAQRVSGIRFEAGSGVGTTGGTEQAISLIRDRQNQLMHPTEYVPVVGEMYRGASGGSFRPRAQTDQEKSQVETLGRILSVLEQQLDEQRRNKPSTLQAPDKDK